MEGIVMKQRTIEGQHTLVQESMNLTYARKEPADMPVIVVESVEDVEKLTAMMEQIRRENT